MQTELHLNHVRSNKAKSSSKTPSGNNPNNYKTFSNLPPSTDALSPQRSVTTHMTNSVLIRNHSNNGIDPKRSLAIENGRPFSPMASEN